MKRYLIVILLLAVSLVGYAQKNMTVKGQIVDSAGEPLIGATVKVAGSTAGTVSDLDGNFSLEVPSKTKALVVSFIGYKTQTVTVEGDKPLKVKLLDDANVLNEVVAIGYGAVKKGDVTAAIASVKGEDLEDRPVSNVASALQGELAGVEVRSTTGPPVARYRLRCAARPASTRRCPPIRSMWSTAYLWTTTSTCHCSIWPTYKALTC